MWRFSRCSAGALVMLFALPAAALAQAAITGVVRDTSGAVLPGVTVEAASPVLIERTRSVVSDATGQYRIVDLRPGTYSVTFTLPGFNTVKREGIALTGDFVATVSTELRIGALEETVTVTGESPTVDVQSTRVQNIIDREVLAAIPSSRAATGIQSLVPGMSSSGDSGGITGGGGGMAGFIHGARASDSRTLHDGINTGWAGANSNAAISNVAGSQEVVLTTSGGLGEAETGGAVLNVIPRDGGNTFSGTFFMSGASGGMQGSNYTQALKDAGLRSPQELKKVYEVNPMGGGRIVRDKLWFYLTYREVGAENTVPGMFFNRNAGDPTKWIVDFDTSRLAYNDNVDRNAIARITWQISPRNKLSLSHSQQYSRRNAEGGGQATRTPEAVGLTLYTPGLRSDGLLGLALDEPSPLRGRLGRLLRQVRQFVAAHRRLEPQYDDLGCGTVLERHALSAVRRNPEPGLPPSPAASARVREPSDRHDRADAGVGLVHSRIAQREDRVPGQHQSPESELFQLHAVHSVPVQQRRPESAHPDRHLSRHGEVPAQHPDDVVLRPGYLYACATDAPGRYPLRRHRHRLPGRGCRRPGLSVDADTHLLRGGNDRRDPLEGHHAARRRRVRPVRQRQDGNQGERRQVSDRAHREQQRPRPQPADPHDAPDDAHVERQNDVPGG